MDQRLIELASRIAEALERLAPPPRAEVDLACAEAFVWHPSPPHLAPVMKVSRVDIALLKGVERQKQILLDNTLRFARGLPANNAMLWGARGMGKSSLVKAVHAVANAQLPGSLALVEIHREDVRSLPELLNVLRGQAAPLPDPVRRPVVRARGFRLQGAEVDPGGRHRGTPRERAVLRHLQPPPPDAARHDRERALDRDQPIRGDRGEGVAVRPLRPLAGLPQLRPGHVLRHGRRLCRQHAAAHHWSKRCTPRRSNGR